MSENKSLPVRPGGGVTVIKKISHMNRGKLQKKRRSGKGLIICTSVRAVSATKATKTTSCNKKLATPMDVMTYIRACINLSLFLVKRIGARQINRGRNKMGETNMRRE